MKQTEEQKETRSKLSRLGARRKRNVKEGEELQGDVRDAVKEARDAGVPMDEVAERLGIHRSTLYELYIEKDERAAAA